MPLAKFQQLRQVLPDLPTDNDVVRFACEACNQISAYSKSDLPVPRTIDNLKSVERLVVVERVFAIDIECADSSCASPIHIYGPTGKHYDEEWLKLYLEKNGSPDSSVSCPRGNLAMNPVRVIIVTQI